jgi:hypothetical protein
VNVDSGVPTDVGGSSYDKTKSTGKLEWDLSTPTVLEVAQLASELINVGYRLNIFLAELWDRDPDIAHWRLKEGFWPCVRLVP